MKKILTIFIILVIFSINTAAIEDNITIVDNKSIEEINDVQILLKTSSLGLDKNFNANRIVVNITSSKSGRLTYIENYYSVDGNGNPKFYNSIRQDYDIVADNTISFDVLRPKSGSGRYYSLIKGTILLDNKIVLDEWISLGKKYGTYGSPIIKDNKTNITSKFVPSRPNIEKRVSPFEQNVNNAVQDTENKNIIDQNNTELESKFMPGFQIIGTIIGILVILIYKNRKKNENK